MNDEDKMVADALRGSWVHRFLPQSLWPYAQLARWERPIGWKLLMWPCWWAAAMAVSAYRANHQNMTADTNRDIADVPDTMIFFELAHLILVLAPTLFLFFIGAFVMRGAGCTYNDLVDVDIDAKVARTRSRPLPSGRVTKKNAAIFLGLQLLVGLFVLLQFNWTTIIVGLVSVITIVIYPFMKRITWWPQLFLGFAFSWGALVGWTAVTNELQVPAIMIYLGCICWVIAYDTIYAHQDIEDDALVGVKSTARLFGDDTAKALNWLYGGAIVLWALAIQFSGVSWPAWIALGAATLHVGWQIKTFEPNNGPLALRLFKSNSMVGWILFIGFFVSALV